MNNLLQLINIATGLSPGDILSIARSAPKRYKVYEIPKRSGGTRVIAQPSRELKVIQRVLTDELLSELPVHNSAMAYRIGRNIKQNASRHRSSEVILKLDFENFFPSIKTGDWIKFIRELKPEWASEGAAELTKYIFFWGDGGYEPKCLSIGAPSSPAISNILLYNFDTSISKIANEEGVIYTRYADDITISGANFDQVLKTEKRIRKVIKEMRSPRLRFNEKKRGLYSKGQRRMVTGLVITPDRKVSMGRQRKREISSLIHNYSLGKLDIEEVGKLKGLLGFANAVEKSFIRSMRRKYSDDIIDRIYATYIPRKMLK